MNIEIVGARFNNKGAYLMLLSILQEFAKVDYVDKKINFCMEVTGTNDYLQRARLGLLQKPKYKIKGISFDKLISFLPKRLRDNFGIIINKEVDVILDASGFRYSDQWDLKLSLESYKEYKRYKKQGKKIILMPQAFGPFETEESRIMINKIMDTVDLVFAREMTSYNYLINALDKRYLHKINLSPDFTSSINGQSPEYFVKEEKKIAIVPNIRMLDKYSGKENNYIKLLTNIIKFLIDNGYNPFFLIFEGEQDKEIALKINEILNSPIDIIKEDNPVYSKGIIKDCYAIVSSRFHALSCALSQAIPCIGIGWSHKYEEIFKDYNVEECLLENGIISDYELKNLLNKILEYDRNSVIQRLIESESHISRLNKEMWQKVFDEINIGELK